VPTTLAFCGMGSGQAFRHKVVLTWEFFLWVPCVSQVGEAKTQTAEGIASLRGELARELAAVRRSFAQHEKDASTQHDQLLGWLEKSGQEIVTLNTRVRTRECVFPGRSQRDSRAPPRMWRICGMRLCRWMGCHDAQETTLIDTPHSWRTCKNKSPQ